MGSSNRLVEFWVRFWFSRYLLRLNFVKRKDYLFQLIEDSRKYGLKLMSSLAFQILDELKISYELADTDEDANSREFKVEISPLQRSVNGIFGYYV